jgi:hypothetical protein
MGLLFTDRDMADALARSIRKFDWLVAISTGKSSLCAGFEAGPVAEAGIFSGCKNSPQPALLQDAAAIHLSNHKWHT